MAETYLDSKPKVLVLFDKLSIYKEVLYNSLADALGEQADITILTHNQNLELGKDVFVISYNEFDLNEVVLNGLTTISTDFKMTRRSTF